MNTKSVTKLLIPLLVLLLAISVVGVGCEGAGGQPPAGSAGAELASTLVPNLPLDLYVYSRQENPTRIPAEAVDAPYDVDVESMAVWGVPVEDDFALGTTITLTSASDASQVYGGIDLEEGMWKKLSGNTIYLVYGSGAAAESLKAAVSNNDFKQYDDSEFLNLAAILPSGDNTKLAAVALAKPSTALIGFMTQDAGNADPEAQKMIDMILKVVNLKVIAAGLYSPHQIDIAELAQVIESDGRIAALDLGALVLVKSGLPSFLLKPAIEKFLEEAEFTEIYVDEVTLYRGTWDIGQGDSIPVLVRIEGNYICAAISGQESYAETLIISDKK